MIDTECPYCRYHHEDDSCDLGVTGNYCNARCVLCKHYNTSVGCARTWASFGCLTCKFERKESEE